MSITHESSPNSTGAAVLNGRGGCVSQTGEVEKGRGLRTLAVIYRSVSLSVSPTSASFALIAGLDTGEWGPPSADNSHYPLKM